MRKPVILNQDCKMKTVNELIKEIRTLHSHLHEKDFLLTWERSPDELKQVLDGQKRGG